MSTDVLAADDRYPDAPPLPTYLQIEPVGQCNLRCRMCAVQFRRDGPPHGPLAFMPFPVFRRIVEGFPALSDLHLQGLGEPTMHPQFFEMVAWAASRGIRVSTNSNLTLWSRRRAAQCIDSGLAELSVSLDAATPEIYEGIREGARFAKVLRNLRRVMAARAVAGSSMHVRIVMVLMRRNLHEIAPLVHLAAEEGVAEVFVQRLCHDFDEQGLPSEYRPMRLFIDGEQIAHAGDRRIGEAYAAARQAAGERGVVLRLPRSAPRDSATPGPRCDWPWTGAYVSYRGEAMPCCMIGTPDRGNFGNVLEQGVEATWRSPAYREFRARLASAAPPSVCRSCALYRGTF